MEDHQNKITNIIRDIFEKLYYELKNFNNIKEVNDDYIIDIDQNYEKHCFIFEELMQCVNNYNSNVDRLINIMPNILEFSDINKLEHNEFKINSIKITDSTLIFLIIKNKLENNNKEICINNMFFDYGEITDDVINDLNTKTFNNINNIINLLNKEFKKDEIIKETCKICLTEKTCIIKKFKCNCPNYICFDCLKGYKETKTKLKCLNNCSN